jgi:hypothetical protein
MRSSLSGAFAVDLAQASAIGAVARGVLWPCDVLERRWADTPRHSAPRLGATCLRFAPVQGVNVAFKFLFASLLLAQPAVQSDARLAVASNFVAGGAAGACAWLVMQPVELVAGARLHAGLLRGLPHAVTFRCLSFGLFDTSAPLTARDYPVRVGAAFCAAFVAALCASPFGAGRAGLRRVTLQALPGALVLPTVEFTFRARDDPACVQWLREAQTRMTSQRKT